MLLLNVLEGQRIRIGEENYLTLLELDPESWTALVRLETPNEDTMDFALRSGRAVQLLPEVTLMLNRILVDVNTYAVLGFKAPREIPIRGLWAKKARRGASPVSSAVQLRNYSMDELLRYAEQYAESALEKELVGRLDKATRDGNVFSKAT